MNATDLLAEKLERWTGIALERLGSRDEIAAFVADRSRALSLGTPDVWVRRLQGPDDPEVTGLVGLIGAGCSWFFRDRERLADATRLLRSMPQRTLRVWVAGCGAGEEAWVLAMLARSAGRPAEVLGTDLNERALTQARAARYAPWALRTLPARLKRYLASTADGRLQVVPALRAQVRFERRNLVDAPPTVEGGWDLIVCRGVLGFFRPSRLARTLGQLQAVLAPTGAIVLGEGEAPPRVRGELSVSGGALTVLRPTRPTGAARAPAPPRRVRPSVARALAVGHARLQEGDPEQALSQFSEALLRDPLCAEAHLLTGLACHRLGDHGSATQALQGALFLSPGLWPAAFYLGLSYDELGDPEAARGAFERLLKTSELRPRRNVLQSPVLAELEGWKPDAVALARKRTRRPPRRTGSTSAAHG